VNQEEERQQDQWENDVDGIDGHSVNRINASECNWSSVLANKRRTKNHQLDQRMLSLG